MFDWFSLADRLMVGVPVMIAVVTCVLLMCKVEEHARQTRARKARRRGR
jgi:hypothetical protein